MQGQPRELAGRTTVGMRRVQVHWRLMKGKRGYERLLQVIVEASSAAWLGSFGSMELTTADGLAQRNRGKHHMGTPECTRPSKRGRDPDCKVKDAHFDVAGSSVFPTGGYANPTLTIAALAIRLADRLKARWKSPGG